MITRRPRPIWPGFLRGSYPVSAIFVLLALVGVWPWGGALGSLAVSAAFTIGAIIEHIHLKRKYLDA